MMKRLLIITFLLSSLSLSTLAQGQRKNTTAGFGAESLLEGELSTTYGFFGNFFFQYNYLSSTSLDLFIDTNISNSFQLGSTYTQLALGNGVRYFYGSLGPANFFVEGSLQLAYSRETFYFEFFGREIERTFYDTGANARLGTGIYFGPNYGFTAYIKENFSKNRSYGLNILFSF